jgi:N6-adenosine-specific RNA methylase IME4
LVEATRGKHSEKPNEVRQRIVEMFGDELPKVELFARENYNGWDAWGNEVENSIDLSEYYT